MRFLILLAALAVSGCAGDFLKDIEGKAYDSAAASVSQYCKDADLRPLIIQRTRIEARREIRQRGTNGPLPPTHATALDDNTALSGGPVVVVYCVGDTVPDQVWEDMVRDWQD